jgi:hypothetical protein
MMAIASLTSVSKGGALETTLEYVQRFPPPVLILWFQFAGVMEQHTITSVLHRQARCRLTLHSQRVPQQETAHQTMNALYSSIAKKMNVPLKLGCAHSFLKKSVKPIQNWPVVVMEFFIQAPA